jgi:hypothetical protein
MVKMLLRKLRLIPYAGFVALGLSDQGVKEYERDKRFEKDLKRICYRLSLDMKETAIWKLYDVPYNPLVPWAPYQEELETIIKDDNATRRFYDIKRLALFLEKDAK